MTFGLPDPDLARLLLRDDPPPKDRVRAPAPDLHRLALMLAATVPLSCWLPWR